MTSSADNTSGTRSRVLIVDDSPDVHRLLRARLKQEEIDIVSAESGQAGLDEVAKQRPSLVLLDLDMPGMDGFEFLRKMKENGATHHIPVVILSAMSNPQDKVAAFDLGAHDFVTKPFELTELRVRIRAALRMNALLQMLSQRAQIDGLTGLWNRAYFDQRVQDEVARVQRHPGPLSIAFIDADGRILNIEDMRPQTEETHWSKGPALYALEMKKGWFAERGIGPGAAVAGIPRVKADP